MKLIEWLLAFIIAPWLLVAGFVFGFIWLELNHPGIAGTILLILMLTVTVKFVHWGINRHEVHR